ncbi:hypothetical protein, partial [Isoptericola sp. NPDC055881]
MLLAPSAQRRLKRGAAFGAAAVIAASGMVGGAAHAAEFKTPLSASTSPANQALSGALATETSAEWIEGPLVANARVRGYDPVVRYITLGTASLPYGGLNVITGIHQSTTSTEPAAGAVQLRIPAPGHTGPITVLSGPFAGQCVAVNTDSLIDQPLTLAPASSGCTMWTWEAKSQWNPQQQAYDDPHGTLRTVEVNAKGNPQYIAQVLDAIDTTGDGVLGTNSWGDPNRPSSDYEKTDLNWGATDQTFDWFVPDPMFPDTNPDGNVNASASAAADSNANPAALAAATADAETTASAAAKADAEGAAVAAAYTDASTSASTTADTDANASASGAAVAAANSEGDDDTNAAATAEASAATDGNNASQAEAAASSAATADSTSGASTDGSTQASVDGTNTTSTDGSTQASVDGTNTTSTDGTTDATTSAGASASTQSSGTSDASGEVYEPVTITNPPQNGRVYPRAAVRGTGEPGATVDLKDIEGIDRGTTTVREDGTWSLTVDGLRVGENALFARQVVGDGTVGKTTFDDVSFTVVDDGSQASTDTNTAGEADANLNASASAAADANANPAAEAAAFTEADSATSAAADVDASAAAQAAALT